MVSPTKIYDRNGTLRRSLPGPHEVLSGLSFSSDGRWLASASYEGLQLYKVEDWSERRLLGHVNVVDAVSFSGDGRFLLSTGHDGTARQWNLESGEHVIYYGRGREWIIFAQDGYVIRQIGWCCYAARPSKNASTSSATTIHSSAC